MALLSSISMARIPTRGTERDLFRTRVRCGLEDSPDRIPAKSSNNSNIKNNKQQQQQPQVDSSTDWIASSLTRRFGLGAGLGYVGFLAFGVISEQIKTRTEVALEQQGTRDVEGGEEVVLPNGVRYVDLTVGGGAVPQRGDLLVVDVVGKINGGEDEFVDTISKGRPLVFVYGARPYSGGMCDGLEFVLKSMKAGGKRKAFIPSELGFGDQGAEFGVDVNSALDYTLWLRKVSIAPS